MVRLCMYHCLLGMYNVLLHSRSFEHSTVSEQGQHSLPTCNIVYSMSLYTPVKATDFTVMIIMSISSYVDHANLQSYTSSLSHLPVGSADEPSILLIPCMVMYHCWFQLTKRGACQSVSSHRCQESALCIQYAGETSTNQVQSLPPKLVGTSCHVRLLCKSRA